MWFLLWLVVLCLVHIQFRYCSAVTICFLKVIETSIIVAAIQIYFMDFHTDILLQNATQIVQSFLKSNPSILSDL